MKTKKLISALLILVMVIGITACGGQTQTEAEKTRIFTDSAGREVEIPVDIDAIAPSGPLAQIVLYTACPDKLAGIAVDFSDNAKQLIDKKYWGMTRFGQFYGKNASLNMEALIEADPDVIVDIGEAKSTVVEDMDGLQQQLNIPVVFIEATLDTMDEAYAMIGDLIGDTTDTDTLGAYCKEVSSKADEICLNLSDENKVTVYQALGDTGLNTNASGSFQAEVIDKIGGKNVAEVEIVSTGGGSEVSMEQVMVWNPDVILADSDDLYQYITTDSTWAELDAVKNGRVYKTPDVPYSVMGNPPSVNRVMGILWLGNILYPEQYNIDIVSELINFYHLFYHVEIDQTQAKQILEE